MAERPGYIKNPAKPIRTDETTFPFVDLVMMSLPVLLRDERFPMVKMERATFVPGTDGGITIIYSSAGRQFQRHVTPDEMAAVQKDRSAPEPEPAGEPEQQLPLPIAVEETQAPAPADNQPE